MRLLAISGSLRRDSYNSALLRAAAAECPRDVGFRFWPGLAQIPAYNEDLNSIPLPVVVLRTELAHADAVLFATPERLPATAGCATRSSRPGCGLSLTSWFT
jgi:chromate reductase